MGISGLYSPRIPRNQMWLMMLSAANSKYIPSLKLTYPLKIDPRKRRLLLETIIFQWKIGYDKNLATNNLIFQGSCFHFNNCRESGIRNGCRPLIPLIPIHGSHMTFRSTLLRPPNSQNTTKMPSQACCGYAGSI